VFTQNVQTLDETNYRLFVCLRDSSQTY